jgi:hypothetical protein
MIENGRTKRISEILAITDHDIEAIGSFKNLQTVNDNTNDETEEIKGKITAANTAYSPLCTLHLDVNRSTEIIK